MGACWSKSERETNPPARTVQGASDHIDGISNNSQKLLNTAREGKDYIGYQFSQDEPPTTSPPAYDLSGQILRHFPEAITMEPSLRRLAEWEYRIIIDERSRDPLIVRNGILLLGWIVIVLLQAFEASATLGFTTYMNPEMTSFSEEEQQAAMELNKLFHMETAAAIQQRLETSVLPVKLLQNQLKEKLNQIMADPTIKPTQRYPRLLGVIRDMKLDFSDPWRVEDLSFTNFSKVFSEAIEENKKQPRVLSNLSFNIIRAVQELRKETEDRKNDMTSSIAPKKIIIITGTKLAKSESQKIQRELKQTTEGASECSLEILHLYDHPSAVDGHQENLDNANEGDADIYDYTAIDAEKLLKYGPSGSLLVKATCSHKRAVDKMKRKDFFGDQAFDYSGDSKIHMPDKTQVRKAMGISQDFNNDLVS